MLVGVLGFVSNITFLEGLLMFFSIANALS
jgi:hypothetical protein